MRAQLLLASLLLLACGESTDGTDGGFDAAVDAGAMRDAGADAGGPSDAGDAIDAGVDAGVPVDAGPPGAETLVREDGCFFTPSASEPLRVFDFGETGVAYQRVVIRFDVVAASYRPHVPDPSNRTEHILFGLFRDNQPRNFQRYLGGVAAVDFQTRAPHFRMFGRDEIAMGFMSYASDSGTYLWEPGTRYTVECVFDAVTPQQSCTLATGGSVVATRTLPVPYLDPAMHFSTGFELHMGTDIDNEIEASPHGWDLCDLRVETQR